MKTYSFFTTCILALACWRPCSAQQLEVYVCDAGNFNLPPWQILQFDENGENGKVFISDHLDWPQDLVFLEASQTVLVSNLNSGTISKFDAATGAYIEEFATGIGGPTRMEIGPDSLLYVLQWQGNGKVRRYQLDGSLVDEFTATGVGTCIGLDWDALGNLYLASYNGGFVKKFSPAGEDLGLFVSAGLAGPTNIWFADNGDLLVVDYNGGAVKRFDSSGNFLELFISGLPQGEGVDFFPNGDIAIGCGGDSSVRVYDAAGIFVKNLVPPGTLGLITPNAVVFRPVAASATEERPAETMFLSPSVGTVFRCIRPDSGAGALVGEVFDSSGAFVRQFNLDGNSVWDASSLPNGVYFIRAKLADGSLGHQRVVVQH